MIISNTEVTMFNTCRRQHYFRFGLDIEPRFENLGPALQRGIIGHEALNAFYTTKRLGGSKSDCLHAADQVIEEWVGKIVLQWPEKVKLLEVVCALKPLIHMYADLYEDEPFRVIETESFYKTPVTDEHDYGMRLDILVEFTGGEFRGDLAILDHKFVYNFKSDKELAMDGQLAKYVRTLRDNGFVITKGIFNQLRYRSLKNPTPDDLFRRDLVKAKRVETDRIWKEQAISAREIAYYRSLPRAQFADEAVRNLSPFTCKYCHFQPLCKSELLGESIELNVNTNYQPNTYGYADLLMAE